MTHGLPSPISYKAIYQAKHNSIANISQKLGSFYSIQRQLWWIFPSKFITYDLTATGVPCRGLIVLISNDNSASKSTTKTTQNRKNKETKSEINLTKLEFCSEAIEENLRVGTLSCDFLRTKRAHNGSNETMRLQGREYPRRSWTESQQRRHERGVSRVCNPRQK